MNVYSKHFIQKYCWCIVKHGYLKVECKACTAEESSAHFMLSLFTFFISALCVRSICKNSSVLACFTSHNATNVCSGARIVVRGVATHLAPVPNLKKKKSCLVWHSTVHRGCALQILALKKCFAFFHGKWQNDSLKVTLEAILNQVYNPCLYFTGRSKDVCQLHYNISMILQLN